MDATFAIITPEVISDKTEAPGGSSGSSLLPAACRDMPPPPPPSTPLTTCGNLSSKIHDLPAALNPAPSPSPPPSEPGADIVWPEPGQHSRGINQSALRVARNNVTRADLSQLSRWIGGSRRGGARSEGMPPSQTRAEVALSCFLWTLITLPFRLSATSEREFTERGGEGDGGWRFRGNGTEREKEREKKSGAGSAELRDESHNCIMDRRRCVAEVKCETRNYQTSPDCIPRCVPWRAHN